MDTLSYDQVPARNTNAVLGDSYIIGRRLGRGAMGEVYEAQHVRLPGKFAVKLLLPELQGNQEAFARFCREAEIMSQLRHPNIVQIFDFNVAPDARPYFVMEYLEGRDLEARLRAGALDLPAITRIVDAVASALALAHAHGVVHRDLKPANIFLATVDGQTDELVKVLDFGISKVRAAAAQISQAVDLLGTPSYMSPEQARGQGDAIDGRTDQFALAAIAYRMLTNQEPFQGDDTAAVLYQVVHEEPPALSLFLPAGWDPRPLQGVLQRALAKQPEQRFGGMMELARAFDDAVERTIGAGALAQAAARARPRPAPRRLDDADIDPPPPVRTPTPVVVSPPRQLPQRPALRTPPPALDPPAPALRPPAPARKPLTPPPTPQILDWELPSNVDKVPVSHAGRAVFAVIVLLTAAVLIATGWWRKLPGIGGGLRQRVHEWTRPPGATSGQRVEPAAPAAAPAAELAPRDLPVPAPAAPVAAPSGNGVPEQKPSIDSHARAPAPTAPEKKRARSHAATAPRARRPPPSDLATEVPGDPDAPMQIGPRVTTPAPAPTPTPTPTPALNGGAFEIAPPTPTTEPPRRDLAPPSSDDTLPMSPR